MADEKRKASVQKLRLLKVGKVAMTTDMWTEDYLEFSYLTITCHFISEAMELVNKTLTTTIFRLEEAKSVENIRLVILFSLTVPSIKSIYHKQHKNLDA